MYADPIGHAVCYISLRQLDCWDRRFETQWRHGCSSLMFVVCCVRKWPLWWTDHLFESPTRCVCLTVHDLVSSIMMQPRSNLGCSTTESYIYFDRWSQTSGDLYRNMRKCLSCLLLAVCTQLVMCNLYIVCVCSMYLMFMIHAVSSLSFSFLGCS
jgi:hypothetical protein